MHHPQYDHKWVVYYHPKMVVVYGAVFTTLLTHHLGDLIYFLVI